MKIGLPQFDESPADPVLASLFRRLRQTVDTLERVFSRININGPLIIGGGQTIEKHMSATTTWDPGNLAAGGTETKTVTVTGAALGDEVTCSFSLSLQGMQLTGYVSAANTATCVLYNCTAGALDLASGTLRASVWRH